MVVYVGHDNKINTLSLLRQEGEDLVKITEIGGTHKMSMEFIIYFFTGRWF